MASTIRSSAASADSRFGAKPPSSPRPVLRPRPFQHRLERVEGLRAPAQRLGEGLRADRRDHELLDVDRIVGVRAAVDDVHHRHRQQVRVRAAEVAEQRQRGRLGGGLGDRERDAEDRVGAEPALVRGAVQVLELLVDQPLLVRVEADQRRADLVEDREHGLGHALAVVPALVTVAQLHRLEGSGGRAGRDRRAGDHSVVERDLDLDGGVPAGVEDLPRADCFDGRHVRTPSSSCHFSS
jgi:hypothetical protein